MNFSPLLITEFTFNLLDLLPEALPPHKRTFTKKSGHCQGTWKTPKFRVSSLKCSSPPPPTIPQQHATLIRRANWRGLGTFYKMVFPPAIKCLPLLHDFSLPPALLLCFVTFHLFFGKFHVALRALRSSPPTSYVNIKVSP
jgi:hypothetical protein